MVKGPDYSQKVRRFNWNKLGGSESALLEAQKWRDEEEQKLKDNLDFAIVEHAKTVEENKKLKEQQEADYKRLREKEELELQERLRKDRARERLLKSKKLQEIQEDLDYFNEILTMNIEQVRAKWDSGVWDHLDPKGNRFVDDPEALEKWIKSNPTDAESEIGKKLIKNYKPGKSDYKCVYMIKSLYNKMKN
jgi:hypothetical protein